MKRVRSILCCIMIPALLFSMTPITAAAIPAEPAAERGVRSTVFIDGDPNGGYTGDYVVIYNPDTDAASYCYTGDLNGLIQTTVGSNAAPTLPRSADAEARPWRIDVDQALEPDPEAGKSYAFVGTKTSFSVGSRRTFTIYAGYSPTGSSSLEFKCLAVGQHCYVWTPVSNAAGVYPLDAIDPSYAQIAANEFDSKFALMQSSFGSHENGAEGDGKLHILYYNIDEGWQLGQGYIAGFFWASDLDNNGLPLLNVDTYPGVYYTDSNGPHTHLADSYGTMVHEYQHLINYSNTPGMESWLNECFSAGAEEICYPGSSVIPRIQSWENHYFLTDWQNPPAEYEYQPDFALHNGYSLYGWDNGLSDVLALYAQVAFFSQYLFSRFGNSIYREISSHWNYFEGETAAITAATGVSCSELARDFRVAVTANATQDQYDGRFGFRVQDGYRPSDYHDVQNPWSLLSPVVFTGSGCSIQGGGSITVKPVNGVYYPPVGADPNLQYVGISFSPPYQVTAVSNNAAWGAVSISGYRITAVPAAGCYVAGYDVISGSASVTQSGNSFTVTPHSDCTIRINFAPRPSCTVTFLVCGQSAGSQTVLLHDQITLPSAVSVGVNGWTFCGWSPQPLPAETAQQPTLYAPGSVYTVTGSVTLYAVYSRQEGDSPACYRLVDSVPADWSGTYVISHGTAADGMYLLKGNPVNADGTSLEAYTNAASYQNAGVWLSGDTLYSVSDAYRFVAERRGEVYSVQNVQTGVFLGLNEDICLAGYTSFDAARCSWILGPGENASSMQNTQYGSYPYLCFNEYSACFWTYASADSSVRFWRQYGGYTTYYSTAPVEIHYHTPVYSAAEPPSCGAPGHTAYYRCSGCGKYFADEACTQEISPESTVIPATGNHSYGAWYSNQNGTHARVCAVCGDTDVADCDYETVVTVPNCTEGGITTHVCTVCSYVWTENETAPLGHDWDEGVVLLEPTDDEDGLILHVCRRCGVSQEFPIPKLNPFVDNVRGRYYYDAVLWAYHHDPQITAGTDETHFSPGAPCTREQIVFFLWSARGRPAPDGTASGFDDVCETDYFYDAVRWAQEQGITCGVSETRFGVGCYCTRAQTVTFLWRAAGSPEAEGTELPFLDLSAQDYCFPAVCWALERQITSGIDAERFGTTLFCTRAAAVTFLHAADEPTIR